MPVPPIAITAFGGEVPAVDERLLGDANAADSINAWLFSGRIEPVHALVPLHTLTEMGARAVFRLPKGNSGVDNMVDSYWLEFQNEKIRVIKSPTPNQTENGRYYWADGVYPKVMTGDMIAAAASPYRLGVPAPHTAPGVTVSGGVSSVNKTVGYVYTWVSGLSEEGQPSPATVVTNKIDATYHITLTAPLAADTLNRNLTKVRIYRTVVSAQGVATYFFVVELPIATLTYDDDCTLVPDSVIVNNEQLATTYWAPPPADLQGLVVMPNGMIVGWRDNEVWFCEPYVPHAWPPQYMFTVDPKIVGLGVYNQSLIILGEGQPYAATGIHPASMTLAKVQPLEPCTSQLSIVNTPNGVLYSSPNGLINITPAGAVNLTLQQILKDQWNGMLNIGSIMASIISQGYYCYSGPVVGVFQEDAFQSEVNTPGKGTFQVESAYGTRPGAYISLNDQRMGVTVLDPAPSEVFNVITDIFNGETMVLRDGVVYLVDIRKTAPYQKYRWRSKIFTLPYLQNLGAAKVYWTPQDPTTVGQDSYFRVFAGQRAELTDDGLPLRFQQKMTKAGQMFRLPSGFKAQYYQFEVEGYVVINAIHAAQTPHELRQI